MANDANSFRAEEAFFSRKLFLLKLAKVGGNHKLFSKSLGLRTSLECVTSGLVIFHPFWMKLFIAKTGRRLPCGDTWFAYISFLGELYPNGKRFYRLKSRTGNSWSIHSF